jgi:tetratricopeptide (TPR) repeat protein
MRNGPGTNHSTGGAQTLTGDDQTIEAALKILEESPDETLALRYLARLYSNLKDFDQAEPLWAKLAILTADEAEPFLQLARIRRQKGDWRGCQIQADHCLRLKPNHTEALIMHLQCSLKLKSPEKVAPIFGRLCELKPDSCVDLAGRAASLGMTAEIAPGLLSLADSGFAEAATLCQELAQAERDAAIGFELQGNTFSAAKSYRTMRALETEKSSYAATSLARLRKPYLERARKCYQNSDDTKAFEHCVNCIRIEPQEAEPYIIAGRSLTRAGELDKAFDYLSRGMQAAKADAWLCINFARSAERLGRASEAYYAFLQAKQIGCDRAQNHLEEIEKSLSRLPGRMVREAQTFAESGNQILAMQLARKIREDALVDEEQIDTLCQRIVTHAQRQLRAVYDAGSEEALGLAEALAAFKPSEPYAFRVAGRLLLRARRYEEAVGFWTSLAEREPSNVEYHLNIARCYHRARDHERVEPALHKLLLLEPEHEEGAFMLRALREEQSDALATVQ